MLVNDAMLEYVDEGTGTPVLFVHGAIPDLRAWEQYRPSIAAEHRFVAYTQRFFGTSTWPDDGARVQRTVHVADPIGRSGLMGQGDRMTGPRGCLYGA